MAGEEDTPAKWALIREWDAWASKNPDDAKSSFCILRQISSR